MAGSCPRDLRPLLNAIRQTSTWPSGSRPNGKALIRAGSSKQRKKPGSTPTACVLSPTSLQENGMFLAKGDRRGFVVLDHGGEVYALSRLLGAKTKDVSARLGKPDALPSVDDTRKTIGERMTPALRRHIDESRSRYSAEAAQLEKHKAEITKLHQQARLATKASQRAEWDAENLVRAKRLPRGLRGFWKRLTGEYSQIRKFNESEAASTRLRAFGRAAKPHSIATRRGARFCKSASKTCALNKQPSCAICARKLAGSWPFLEACPPPFKRGVFQPASSSLAEAKLRKENRCLRTMTMATMPE